MHTRAAGRQPRTISGEGAPIERRLPEWRLCHCRHALYRRIAARSRQLYTLQ